MCACVHVCVCVVVLKWSSVQMAELAVPALKVEHWAKLPLYGLKKNTNHPTALCTTAAFRGQLHCVCVCVCVSNLSTTLCLYSDSHWLYQGWHGVNKSHWPNIFSLIVQYFSSISNSHVVCEGGFKWIFISNGNLCSHILNSLFSNKMFHSKNIVQKWFKLTDICPFIIF